MFQLEIWFEMIVFNFSTTLTLLQICNTCHYINFIQERAIKHKREFTSLAEGKSLVLFPASFWLRSFFLVIGLVC